MPGVPFPGGGGVRRRDEVPTGAPGDHAWMMWMIRVGFNRGVRVLLHKRQTKNILEQCKDPLGEGLVSTFLNALRCDEGCKLRIHCTSESTTVPQESKKGTQREQRTLSPHMQHEHHRCQRSFQFRVSPALDISNQGLPGAKKMRRCFHSGSPRC